MTFLAERYVDADTLSDGWLEAVRLLRPVPGHKVVHLLVRIRQPNIEDLQVRADAQDLIEKHNSGKPEKDQLGDIDTVRNTIFPASWASRRPKPTDLVAHYRKYYTKEDLLGFAANKYGTYFGRIVAYPRENGLAADQLTATIKKLRDEINKGTKKSSCYEINIYNERLDRRRLGFPCLAHLSVHQHQARLHLQAIYRNEYLVARGYGNYLGLAELQSYMAAASGLKLGELMITAGHAELDTNLTPVDAMLKRRPRTSEP
jgi:thymidylate synthase